MRLKVLASMECLNDAEKVAGDRMNLKFSLSPGAIYESQNSEINTFYASSSVYILLPDPGFTYYRLNSL